MDGKDFWNGALESPYWSIKLRKSFLSFIIIPLSSDNSLSSQFAAKNNSVIEAIRDDFLKTFKGVGTSVSLDRNIYSLS